MSLARFILKTNRLLRKKSRKCKKSAQTVRNADDLARPELPFDCEGRTIWIADAHRGNGKRFVVRADEKLTAFLKLESPTGTAANYLDKLP